MFYSYLNFFRPRKKLQERGALFTLKGTRQKARENIAFCLAAKSLAKKALPYSQVFDVSLWLEFLCYAIIISAKQHKDFR